MDVDSHDTNNRVIGTTVKGKKIAVYLDRQGYNKIKFLTGGQLPAELTGRYTTYQDAENAAKMYLHADSLKKPVTKTKVTVSQNK